MENKSCVLVGCTKDSGSYIEGHIMKLYKLKDFFKRFHIILFENDSEDNTLEVLKILEQKYPEITILSEKNVVKKINWPFRLSGGRGEESPRTGIIAYARNRLIEKVEQDYGDWDYMIIADLDDIISRFNAQNFKKILDFDESTWDVLTANRIGAYYDTWALRFDRSIWTKKHASLWKCILDFDCWDMIKHYRQCCISKLSRKERRIINSNIFEHIRFLKQNKQEAIALYIEPYQRIIPVTSGLIRVISAFGGLAIYKIAKIKGCRYSGFKQTCDCKDYSVEGECRLDQCEHVIFHKQMIKKHNARIFICSKLLLSGGSEHIH